MYLIIGRINQGYRIYSTKDKQIKDLTEREIISLGIKLENAEVVDSKLKGINGSLERYGVVGEKEVAVIVSEIHWLGGGLIGYYEVISNNSKESVILDTDKVKELVERTGLANGKLVRKKFKNRSYISPIKGSYPVKFLETQFTNYGDNSVIYNEMVALLEQNKRAINGGRSEIAVEVETNNHLNLNYGMLGTQVYLWEQKGFGVAFKDLQGRGSKYYNSKFIEYLKSIIKESTEEGKTKGVIIGINVVVDKPTGIYWGSQ